QRIYQCKNPKHWAMTYDDGPTEYTDAILDLLKKYNIKATFFVVGNLYINSKKPEWSRIIKRMNDEGHIIGNHTYNHVSLPGLTVDEIKNEMKLLENEVYRVIGKKPAFMRFPNALGGSDKTVMSTLESLGFNAAVFWNVDTVDYGNGGDAEYAVSVIDKQASAGNSLITLNHLLYSGATKEGIIKLATAEIERILALGYKPVTMEECLGISAYQ
ncbi:carbohydrate esterase family 4 protein, partial [Piromyces sp. E2]